LQIRSHLGHCGSLVTLAGLLICQSFQAMAAEPVAAEPVVHVEPVYGPPLYGVVPVAHEPFNYIEPAWGPRIYAGDEDTRRGWAHLLSGDYGLAEQYYRRGVEATHQNGSAWVGLAASYDRLGRFDLADRAYRHAIRLLGENHVILNKRGYSYLLRGDIRRARSLLHRAWRLSPGDPTIANNLAVLESGQAYFLGLWP
jgi:tetratricopeptide (TPR) repeat protein